MRLLGAAWGPPRTRARGTGGEAGVGVGVGGTGATGKSGCEGHRRWQWPQPWLQAQRPAPAPAFRSVAKAWTLPARASARQPARQPGSQAARQPGSQAADGGSPIRRPEHAPAPHAPACAAPARAAPTRRHAPPPPGPAWSLQPGPRRAEGSPALRPREPCPPQVQLLPLEPPPPSLRQPRPGLRLPLALPPPRCHFRLPSHRRPRWPRVPRPRPLGGLRGDPCATQTRGACEGPSPPQRPTLRSHALAEQNRQQNCRLCGSWLRATPRCHRPRRLASPAAAQPGPRQWRPNEHAEARKSFQ